MTSKVAIGLVVLLGISIFINYQFYQNNNVLVSQIYTINQQIDHFQKQIEDLQKQIELLDSQKTEIEKLKIPMEQKTVSEPHEISDSKSITAVAVSSIIESDGFFQQVRYVGTTMKITVNIKEGSGLVLVNTIIPTGVDFQTSAKTAVAVAQKYTNVDLSNQDIIFTISSENDLKAVDGTSAGVAMTVVLVKELLNEPIKDDILLTGTIEIDGSIGKVGGISEKAEVAGKVGAKLFIVPKEQAITYVQECQEKKEGPFLYRNCRSEVKDLSPILEEKYGMSVVEATNLNDVLTYFE